MKKYQISQKPWEPYEDQILMSGVETFGTRWIEIAKSLRHRSFSSIRNRYQRIQFGKKMRENGSLLKNSCVKCGEFRLGHICRSSSPHLTPSNFNSFREFANAVKRHARLESETEAETCQRDDECDDSVNTFTVDDADGVALQDTVQEDEWTNGNGKDEGYNEKLGQDGNHTNREDVNMEQYLEDISAEMALEFVVQLFVSHPDILDCNNPAGFLQHENFVRDSARDWFREQQRRFM